MEPLLRMPSLFRAMTVPVLGMRRVLWNTAINKGRFICQGAFRDDGSRRSSLAGVVEVIAPPPWMDHGGACSR